MSHTAEAPPADRKLGALERQAARFADEFIRDYASNGGKSDHGQLEVVALRLSPALRRALRADYAAQEADPGDIVGLDWDPFLSAQETPKTVAVGPARCQAARCQVPVYATFDADKRPQLTSHLLLRRSGRGFLVFDVKDDEGGDLLSALHALSLERARGAPRHQARRVSPDPPVTRALGRTRRVTAPRIQ